ncbi:MAG: hypothetical protein JRD89_21260 [Deltaproteobacteria bacterium]|nr:hypothetical protein [Deltaproteobacteria bacterium]
MEQISGPLGTALILAVIVSFSILYNERRRWIELAHRRMVDSIGRAILAVVIFYMMLCLLAMFGFEVFGADLLSLLVGSVLGAVTGTLATSIWSYLKRRKVVI